MSGVGFTAVGVFIAAFKPTLWRVQAYTRHDKLLSVSFLECELYNIFI